MNLFSRINTIQKTANNTFICFNNNLSKKHKKIWAIYFLVKVLYMFFALFVFSKVTTLGDSLSYTYARNEFSADILYNSTTMMKVLGKMLWRLTPLSFLPHIVFLSIAFYGIYHPLQKLQLTQKQLIYTLFLLSFPTFSVWTSIISKECVGVFYMGVILGHFIDIAEKKPRWPNFIELLAYYLLIVFKPHFSIALAHVLLFCLAKQLFPRKPKLLFGLLITTILVDFIVLFLFRDIISAYSFEIARHFPLNAAAQSTRPNTIWVEKYDVFLNAPYGMLISFIGPTIREVTQNPLKVFSFIESAATVFFIIITLIATSYISHRKGRINIFFIATITLFFTWILFVNYPFGALNAGSALRYRANYYHVMVILLIYFWSRMKNSTNQTLIRANLMSKPGV